MVYFRSLIFILLSHLLVSSGFAAELGFRDIPIGMTRSAAWEAVQKYNSHFKPEDERGVISFAADIKGVLALIYASHYEGKIENIIFTFDTPEHKKVFDALIEKYGEPTTIGFDGRENVFGKKTKRLTAHWMHKEGAITFLEFGHDLRLGCVEISSLRWIDLKKGQEESERTSPGF